jgi:hypothetical protein
MVQVEGIPTSALYEMVGFVQLKNQHCKAFARTGNDCFDVYNDARIEWYGMKADAVQIRDWVSLAIYRLIGEV